jgi:predicted anti-sigma-YlaC factor YlaD
MNAHDPKHLTADELDAFLTDSSSHLVASHLATCPACATMVERDGRLIAMLAALPYFDASAGFSDRVLRGITPRQALAAVPVLATPRSVAARRRAIGALLVAGGGMAAGFAWASAHPADALRWSAPALQDTGHALWLSLQTVVANATEQPWLSSLRDAVSTPARALFATAAVAGAYAVGLMGLRRLMTEPATDAGW